MSLRFVPPKQVARYALFIDHGNGNGFFKTYNDVGHAKSAYRFRNWSGRNAAKILEMVDGEWYTLFDIPAGTDRSNLPWVKEVTRHDWYTNRDQTRKKAVPMTREEYAEWRVKVERERWEAEHKGLASSKRVQ